MNRSDPHPAVELAGITKRFPGVVANDDVDIVIHPGTVHAIVGENGAGKSTLMKILYGMQQPDSGSISIDGAETAFRSPRDAIEAGIGMVHQHFMLADQLTVVENVILGNEPRKGLSVDFDHARSEIERLGAAYGLTVETDALVEQLAVGERQRVEILKVLYRGARILILDEPTAALVPQEITELFQSVNDLRDQGVTLIFISHKLDEVLAIADHITVIRAGRTVATVQPDEVTASDLAELMVGSELPTPATRTVEPTGEVALSLQGVTTRDGDRVILDSIDLEVRKGSIVGIAGVEGNGQIPLVDTIMGIRHPDEGSIALGGRDITNEDTAHIRQAGLGIIPEDRHRQALLLESPLWENQVLGHQMVAPNVKGPWIDRAGAVARTEEIIERFDVRTPGAEVPALALSGGNQQKFIIGREMLADPLVLIAAQPTRGIDVGAQAAVWDQIRAARKKGLAVLLLSADLEELLGLSDVVHVVFKGALVAQLDPETVTAEELGSYMTGARRGAGAA